MWFGNEVTPEFWTFTWLSEGFARFFEYYTTNEVSSFALFKEIFNLKKLQFCVSASAVLEPNASVFSDEFSIVSISG